MRILQVIHSLPFYNQAGTEIYAQDLCIELSKKHDVFVFCRICDEKEKEYEVTERNFGGIKAYLINNTLKYYDSFEKLYENDAIDAKFAQILDEIKPGAVHLQHLVFLSLGLIKKIKERGIPIVFTLHDYWLMCPRWHLFKKDNKPCAQAFTAGFSQECSGCLEELFNVKEGAVGLYRFCRKFLPHIVLDGLKRMYFSYTRRKSDDSKCIDKLTARLSKIKEYLGGVDIFLAPSEYLRDRFIEFGISRDKIKLLRPGLSGCPFPYTQKPKTDKIRFAFIGTLLPAKGLHVLIKAFNGIKDDRAQLRIFAKLYRYAGFEDYLPYLKRIVNNRNIRFMAEAEHSKIADIFKEIDVLIVPSLWHENSPLVIQESLSSGTFVIASHIGGIPELIRDGVNGFLFRPDDAAQLKEKIRFIIENREVLDKFNKDKPDVKNIEKNALEIEDIYDKLVAKDRVYGLLRVT